MNKDVPFFANTSDDTHCYQAALKMVLKYFQPKKEYSFAELDKLTAKVEGLWTWPTQGLLYLHTMGFNIVHISDFSIKEFVKHGGTYLIRRYGNEVGKAQIAHSDIPQEQRIYAQYYKLGLHQEKLPTLKEIKKLIDNDYLVICNVNSKMLNQKSGYVGHFVVIFAYNDQELLLHDPGMPPQQNRHVSYSDFLKAWEYPDARSKNILAFRFF